MYCEYPIRMKKRIGGIIHHIKKKSLLINDKAIPIVPSMTNIGSISTRLFNESANDTGFLFVCHSIPPIQMLNWSCMAAYAGQSNGIMITGANHIPRVLILFLLLVLVDVNIRYATSGIIVNAGILVNMANPRNIPDKRYDSDAVSATFPVLVTFFVSFIIINCK